MFTDDLAEYSAINRNGFFYLALLLQAISFNRQRQERLYYFRTPASKLLRSLERHIQKTTTTIAEVVFKLSLDCYRQRSISLSSLHTVYCGAFQFAEKHRIEEDFRAKYNICII